MKISTRKIIYAVISVTALLLIWELIVLLKDQPLIYPGIIQIVKNLISKLNLDTLKLVGYTLLRTTISILIVVVVTLIITFLYLIDRNTISFFTPVINIMRSTPLVVISLFIFLLFDRIGAYIITILVILPVAVEGVKTAVDGIDKNLLDDLKLISPSMFKSIIYVYIPLIKDYLIMVFVQVFGLGFKVMVMGELFCYTKNSIGKELSLLKNAEQLVDLISWGIIIVLLVVIIEFIVKLIVKRQEKIIKVKN